MSSDVTSGQFPPMSGASASRYGRIIRVCSVVLRNARGEILTVRKHGSTFHQLPGGKPEPGETPRQAALREVREELGLDLDPALLEELGAGAAAAVNEPGHTVIGTFFTHPALAELNDAPGSGDAAALLPLAEIEELRFSAPDPNDPSLAHLLREVVLPLLRR